MSRAVTVSALRRLLAIAAVAACISSPVARAEGIPDVIDGTSMLDYRDRPLFHVGSWVRYRTTGKSLSGRVTDYTTTILIAGEEVCWGDPSVWVETWVEKTAGTSATATLVSYSAFGDTMAYRHLAWFQRKSIDGIGEDGKINVTIPARASKELSLRKANWDTEDAGVVIDTLGTESVTIPLGTFKTTPVLHTRSSGGTFDQSDSTIYYQRKDRRTYFLSREIPITGLVKADIDDIQQGKSWAVGHFNRDSLTVLERATGSTMLVAQGRGDLIPKLVPPALRHPIPDRSLVERVLRQPMEPTVRVLRTGGE
jgi:hypothetical protein